MVIATGATSFAQALEMTAEVYRAAGEIMASRGQLAGVAAVSYTHLTLPTIYSV